MNTFKFFADNIRRGNQIDFLLEFNRRLDCHYVCYHNIYSISHPLNPAAINLYNGANNFIIGGQLTSVTELIRYVYLGYEEITGEDYEISYRDYSRILDETYDYLNQIR